MLELNSLKFAEEFGARKWFADWRELLTDDEIDAVYIATPVHLHAEQTIAAAEAGKHILCEKPMGLNVAECDRMIAACAANNVKLSIAYYRHFYPVIARVKEIIASGESVNLFSRRSMHLNLMRCNRTIRAIGFSRKRNPVAAR